MSSFKDTTIWATILTRYKPQLLDMDNIVNTLHIACALSETAKIPGLDVLVKGALKLAEMVKVRHLLYDTLPFLRSTSR